MLTPENGASRERVDFSKIKTSIPIPNLIEEVNSDFFVVFPGLLRITHLPPLVTRRADQPLSDAASGSYPAMISFW